MDEIDSSVLKRFFDDFPPCGKLLIVTHMHPDPDSISSAIGLAVLAHAMGRARTKLVYSGVIGRAENAYMVEALKIPLQLFEPNDLKDADKIAMVDTQPGTGNNSLPARVVPDLVLDHHPQTAATQKVPFVDIRRHYGATASIITEALFKYGIEVDENVATALLYGIKAETQDLGREAFEVDVACYLKLFPKVNQKLLSKITKPRVRREYFDFLQKGIQNAETYGSCVISHLPEIYTPDLVPETADLLMRLEGTTWTLVTGVYQSSIYLSIRTTNKRADAGKVMKTLVKNRGTGGGHSHMAGGKIDVRGKEMWEIREIVLGMEQVFLQKIHKDHSPHESLIRSQLLKAL